MPRIDLPTGISGSADIPRSVQNLKNCFNTGNKSIMGVPGITSVATKSGLARGSFEWNGSLYGVYGEQLLKFTNVVTGATSVIGTITGAQNIKFAVGFTFVVIIVQAAAGKLYTLSTADALVDISGNSNFDPCRDLTFVDARWVYIPFDGTKPAFFSDANAPGTVQATSFFDAEELPDKNRGIINLKNTIYIFGEDSAELFRNLPDVTPVPFARIDGARIDSGLVSGVVQYSSGTGADSLVYIGRDRGEAAGVFSIESGGAIKISNQRIDTLLQENYTLTQMETALIERIKWKGHDLLMFTLLNDSFGFYRGEWFLLESLNELEVRIPWKGGFISHFENKYYSFNKDDFGLFADVNTNYGARIERNIDFGFVDPEGRRFAISRAELGVSQGLNTSTTAGSVALFMSRNMKEFPIPLYRDLGKLGEYDKRLVWQPPGGLGNYTGFAGIRIYTTENVTFDTDAFIIDIHQ